MDAEYDEPYVYGRHPSVRAPFPFTEREFARLLILRSRIDGQKEQSSLVLQVGHSAEWIAEATIRQAFEQSVAA